MLNFERFNVLRIFEFQFFNVIIITVKLTSSQFLIVYYLNKSYHEIVHT